MDDPLDDMMLDEADLEPTPINLPSPDMTVMHLRRVSASGDYQNQQQPQQPKAWAPTSNDALMLDTSSLEHIISDSDGAGEDDEDDSASFHSAASRDKEFPLKPRAMDVIFGRGQPLRDHPGNIRMREIIKQYTQLYRDATKQEKSKLLKQIEKAIAANGIRFLLPQNSQDPSQGCKPAAASDIKGKISHGLRDAIKVEDLLDSEFVQLWATMPPSAAPSVTSADLSPLPFDPSPQQNNMNTSPPSLCLGPPPPMLMMPQQQQQMQSFQQQQQQMASQFNNQQFASFQNQHFSGFGGQTTQYHRSPSYLTQNSGSLGPAIFHVSVPQGAATFPTDKTEDDDSSLETAEKGLSSSHRRHSSKPHAARREPSPPPPQQSAIVSAVLAPNHNSFWAKYSRYILILALTIIIVLVVIVGVKYSENDTSMDYGGEDRLPTEAPVGGGDSGTMSTLDQILDRGYLICGVTNHPGFAMHNTTTKEVEGFEVDLCRAVAAAIFGREQFNSGDRNQEPVRYHFMEITERFEVLAKEKADVLFASVTHTMEREVMEPSTQESFTFTTPYLFNGLKLAGRPEYLACIEGDEDSNSTTVTDEEFDAFCDGVTICTLAASTHKDVLEAVLPGVKLRAPPTFETFFKTFQDGDCNLIAGEEADVHYLSQDQPEGTYKVGNRTYSKEPLAAVTRKDDVKFSDFCNWVIQSIITAEDIEHGGGSSLADLPTPSVFGERFEFMFFDAVTVGGDYGAIYNRHLGPVVERSPVNRVNQGTASMFAIPFGKNLQPSNMPVLSGGTLKEILDRGFLKCGITQTAIFAEFDSSAGKWTGLDVDFCRAISAAIFDGAIHVRFDVLPPDERFKALQRSQVDVLSRVTTRILERDVEEESTGVGYSFSIPTFNDEIHFGGDAEFVSCAERLDYRSQGCRQLKICATSSTTQAQILEELVPPEYIVSSTDTTENLERLVEGKCNVIFGGFLEVAPVNALSMGYQGAYVVGNTAFSRESLALVTREEDWVWSSFVNWIAMATIYAEEIGITKNDYTAMPRVNFFSPLVGEDMFRNAIQAVGSYAEIWERNASRRGLERRGRNLMNGLPTLGPQLISDLLWNKPSR